MFLICAAVWEALWQSKVGGGGLSRSLISAGSGRSLVVILIAFFFVIILLFFDIIFLYEADQSQCVNRQKERGNTAKSMGRRGVGA